MSLSIRAALHDDYQQLCQFEQRSSTCEYQAAVFIRQSMELWPHMVLVAELEAVLVGYYVGSVSGRDPCTGWVLRLWVVEHMRRRGIASDLMNQGELVFMNDGISLALLSCSPVNSGALSLYHNLGYHDLRYTPEYFGKGEDRVILMKNLG